MKVILDIDDKYTEALSATMVGGDNGSMHVTSCVWDLSKGNYLKIDNSGHAWQSEDGENYDKRH